MKDAQKNLQGPSEHQKRDCSPRMQTFNHVGECVRRRAKR